MAKLSQYGGRMKGPTIKILNLNENPELRATLARRIATHKKREATRAAKAAKAKK